MKNDFADKIVTRPWGTFQVIKESSTFKIKIITVNPHSRLSYQSHEHRRETWVVTQGVAHVTLDDVVTQLLAYEQIHIPCKSKHRLENRGAAKLVIIEIQEGESFEEEDIVRYEDDYGRS